MKRIIMKPGESALVIVAHPDDETIWMGGLVKENPEVKWTIFSLCRSSDRDREPKFRRVCGHLGANPLMSDLEDEGVMRIKESVPVIKKLIRSNLKNKKFNYIFTHGANGEYGHPRHKGVNLAVRELFKEGRVKADKLLFFNYEKKDKKPFSPPKVRNNSDYIFKLTREKLKEKKMIMSGIYGFAPEGIDTNYCTNPEAFKQF